MSPRALEVIEQEVPMGQLVVCPIPAILTVHGLGSCVAVFLYDAGRRVGGLMHALLPTGSRPERARTPGKFVPSALEAMLHKLRELDVRPPDLIAKVVGGASMFVSMASEEQGIGKRNVSAALRTLAELKIRVAGQDVGGASGRTVRARTLDGVVEVSTLRQPPRLL